MRNVPRRLTVAGAAVADSQRAAGGAVGPAQPAASTRVTGTTTCELNVMTLLPRMRTRTLYAPPARDLTVATSLPFSRTRTLRPATPTPTRVIEPEICA
jgi:hypothetical protein